jgi:hypothetical protein
MEDEIMKRERRLFGVLGLKRYTDYGNEINHNI